MPLHMLRSQYTCICLHLLVVTSDRQAELNTLVLQREQAALRALQESQVLATANGNSCSSHARHPNSNLHALNLQALATTSIAGSTSL